MDVPARAAAATGQLAMAEGERVLLAMTDGSLWHNLVELLGCSDERYAAWLDEVPSATLVQA